MATSVYYLPIAEHSWENLGTLRNCENHESLAQQVFPCLRYAEGQSSVNKHICVLMKHLLSGESYELTQAKVFDMLWSSTVKGQSKTLACSLTIGLQRGCTPTV